IEQKLRRTYATRWSSIQTSRTSASFSAAESEPEFLDSGTNFAREVVAHRHGHRELTVLQSYRHPIAEIAGLHLRVLTRRQRNVLHAMVKPDVAATLVEDRQVDVNPSFEFFTGAEQRHALPGHRGSELHDRLSITSIRRLGI